MDPPEKSSMAVSNPVPTSELSTIELCEELQANAIAQASYDCTPPEVIEATIARGAALLEEFEDRMVRDPYARDEATMYFRTKS